VSSPDRVTAWSGQTPSSYPRCVHLRRESFDDVAWCARPGDHVTYVFPYVSILSEKIILFCMFLKFDDDVAWSSRPGDHVEDVGRVGVEAAQGLRGRGEERALHPLHRRA
jgi:hypothetical protein